jgi:hypothetical protein
MVFGRGFVHKKVELTKKMHGRPIRSGQLRVKAGTPQILFKSKQKNYTGIWVQSPWRVGFDDRPTKVI